MWAGKVDCGIQADTLWFTKFTAYLFDSASMDQMCVFYSELVLKGSFHLIFADKEVVCLKKGYCSFKNSNIFPSSKYAYISFFLLRSTVLT